jgi:hypothetical protein
MFSDIWHGCYEPAQDHRFNPKKLSSAFGLSLQGPLSRTKLRFCL